MRCFAFLGIDATAGLGMAGAAQARSRLKAGAPCARLDAGEPAIQALAGIPRRSSPVLACSSGVCQVHGSLRGRQLPPHDGHSSGSAFQCTMRGLEGAAYQNSEWPCPRPGRDVLGSHLKDGCEEKMTQPIARPPGGVSASGWDDHRVEGRITPPHGMQDDGATATAARLKPARLMSLRPHRRRALGRRTRVSPIAAAS
jgi:hypothetical protein